MIRDSSGFLKGPLGRVLLGRGLVVFRESGWHLRPLDRGSCDGHTRPARVDCLAAYSAHLVSSGVHHSFRSPSHWSTPRVLCVGPRHWQPSDCSVVDISRMGDSGRSDLRGGHGPQ